MENLRQGKWNGMKICYNEESSHSLIASRFFSKPQIELEAKDYY